METLSNQKVYVVCTNYSESTLCNLSIIESTLCDTLESSLCSAACVYDYSLFSPTKVAEVTEQGCT